MVLGLRQDRRQAEREYPWAVFVFFFFPLWSDLCDRFGHFPVMSFTLRYMVLGLIYLLNFLYSNGSNISLWHKRREREKDKRPLIVAPYIFLTFSCVHCHISSARGEVMHLIMYSWTSPRVLSNQFI